MEFLNIVLKDYFQDFLTHLAKPKIRWTLMKLSLLIMSLHKYPKLEGTPKYFIKCSAIHHISINLAAKARLYKSHIPPISNNSANFVEISVHLILWMAFKVCVGGWCVEPDNVSSWISWLILTGGLPNMVTNTMSVEILCRNNNKCFCKVFATFGYNFGFFSDVPWCFLFDWGITGQFNWVWADFFY